MVLHILVHLFRTLYLSIWGALLALLGCLRSGARRPDLTSDDVALVTGAGQGLGRHLALLLADCGATLVLWDIDKEKVRVMYQCTH